MKIGPRRCFGAEIASAPIDEVEIGGHYALLRPQLLHQDGQIGFDAFPQPAAPRNKEEAPSCLLRDRTGAAQALLWVTLMRLYGLVDGVPIESIMLAKFLIFAPDNRFGEIRRHRGTIDPAIVDVVARDKPDQHLRSKRD